VDSGDYTQLIRPLRPELWVARAQPTFLSARLRGVAAWRATQSGGLLYGVPAPVPGANELIELLSGGAAFQAGRPAKFRWPSGTRVARGLVTGGVAALDRRLKSAPLRVDGTAELMSHIAGAASRLQADSCCC